MIKASFIRKKGDDTIAKTDFFCYPEQATALNFDGQERFF